MASSVDLEAWEQRAIETARDVDCAPFSTTVHVPPAVVLALVAVVKAAIGVRDEDHMRQHDDCGPQCPWLPLFAALAPFARPVKHGGYADEHLREISDALGEHTQGRTLLDAVTRLAELEEHNTIVHGQLIEEEVKSGALAVDVDAAVLENTLLRTRLAKVEAKLADSTAYCSGAWPCEASTAAAYLEREVNDVRAQLAETEEVVLKATRCEETGERAQSGACPTHDGDACLTSFVGLVEQRDKWRTAERAASARPTQRGRGRRS